MSDEIFGYFRQGPTMENRDKDCPNCDYWTPPTQTKNARCEHPESIYVLAIHERSSVGNCGPDARLFAAEIADGRE